MNLKIGLSNTGINDAISAVKILKDMLDYYVQQSVEVIAKDGALIAQTYYGGMANVTDKPVSSTQARIVASGGDEMYIAEFGAGDATLDPSTLFSQIPSVPVYPGSYSESAKGKGEYASIGKWEFPPKSDNWMTEVKARQGMYHAKEWIIANGANVAKGVIKL